LQPIAAMASTVIDAGMIPPRFPVTDAQIADVVAEFYACVRDHPGLGPVFAAHVQDWNAHEDKIIRFWRNAILFERGYDGNPLAAHRDAGNVRPGMFDAWLGLFDSVLRRKLPAETAAQWSTLAHRIGAGLRHGLIGPQNGPPSLR
jgi:hemoglobin